MLKLDYNMIVFFLCLLSLVLSTSTDTPASCMYDDVIGTWQLLIGKVAVDCNSVMLNLGNKLTFQYPNVVKDEFNNIGTWTLIYNQGFEAIINNVKYFGFFDFRKINSTYTISYCDQLQSNWYHDILIRQWRCFRAYKLEVIEERQLLPSPDLFSLSALSYGSQKDIVESINKKNIGWKAYDYPEFHDRTLKHMVNMVGGLKLKLVLPKLTSINKIFFENVNNLSKSFDWRNVNGINYISPVRNQNNCGSCYAFASAALLEARFRIKSNNTITPIFSPQDIVECSPYSQGCEGGFPYLVAGKYAEDFGMATENCNRYKGVDAKCSTDMNCVRYFATKYHYIGDFYGGSNEQLMMTELVKNGPIAVGYLVYPDFIIYQGGIYQHDFKLFEMTFAKFGFNPFVLSNHAVIIIGYGENNYGEKFWIAKNSWGSNWGENGFFRIKRGTNECGIESIAFTTEPIYGI